MKNYEVTYELNCLKEFNDSLTGRNIKINKVISSSIENNIYYGTLEIECDDISLLGLKAAKGSLSNVKVKKCLSDPLPKYVELMYSFKGKEKQEEMQKLVYNRQLADVKYRELYEACKGFQGIKIGQYVASMNGHYICDVSYKNKTIFLNIGCLSLTLEFNCEYKKPYLLNSSDSTTHTKYFATLDDIMTEVAKIISRYL